MSVPALVGQHLIYTYGNGWQYEMYVKNATTIDYRIHSGMVGGRWVRDQEVSLLELSSDGDGSGWTKVSWTEPTGTSVSVSVNPDRRALAGTIFFPAWVQQHPERTVCFQNDHLDAMRAYRDAGPTYPVSVVDEAAEITFLEDCGPDDEGVVAVGPGELPDGYADRRN